MFVQTITRLIVPAISRNVRKQQIKQCHSVFGIKDLIQKEQPDSFKIQQVTSKDHGMALDLIKKYYLTEHVLVRARQMDINNDRALDEYLIGVIKQGNTLIAKSEDNNLAGICVGFACGPVDPKNLRTYAFYRQDPNIKDFLYFTAKLQETPNLWDAFKQPKIFEIKMLAVAPEYRRQGLATAMAEKIIEQAHDQQYRVIRLDCINPYDYKVAERCMLQCIVKFPLHKLRGANAPFIKRSSTHNCYVRVYVATRALPEVPDMRAIKECQQDLESLIE